MSSQYLFAVVIALLVFATHSKAAEVTVRVSGLTPQRGEVGCNLFVGSSATAFPMDNPGARRPRLPADGPSVTCRFGDVPDGSYAVSVAHDLNGSNKVDTNLFGFRTNPLGVSNSVRLTLRESRFDEAAFWLEAAKDVLLDVRVAK